MSEQRSVLSRLLVRLTPQFIEEWLGAAGQRFRKTTKLLSDYNREQIQLIDKADTIADMAWKAADGASSVQHAKAEADYAKAENDRMEAELRRRTLTAKARQEDANAERLEAEAGVARVREIQARIELFKQLRDIGVCVTIGQDLALQVSPSPILPTADPGKIIAPGEFEQLVPHLLEVKCPELGELMAGKQIRLAKWLREVGSHVDADEPIYEITTEFVDSEIPSPSTGIIMQIIVEPDAVIKVGQVVAMILPDAHPQ